MSCLHNKSLWEPMPCLCYTHWEWPLATNSPSCQSFLSWQTHWQFGLGWWILKCDCLVKLAWSIHSQRASPWLEEMIAGPGHVEKKRHWCPTCNGWWAGGTHTYVPCWVWKTDKGMSYFGRRYSQLHKYIQEQTHFAECVGQPGDSHCYEGLMHWVISLAHGAFQLSRLD